MLQIVLVVLTSVISKITGLIRELSLAYHYGASSLSDVYLISIAVTTTVTGFITPAINAAYIPHANLMEREKSHAEMEAYTRSLLAWLFGCSLLVILFGEAFPRLLVRLFANGFDQAQTAQCCGFIRFTVLAVSPLLLISVVSGYLQNHNKALLVSLVPIVENTVVVVSIILSKRFGTLWMPVGYLIGGLVAFLPLLLGSRRSGFKIRGPVSLFSSDLIHTVKRMLPVIIGASATQINTLIDRTLASSMREGSITVLYYADRIVGLIIGIVILAPLTVLFPKMSKRLILHGKQSFGEMVSELSSAIFVICMFGTLSLCFYSNTAVRLVFARGAFQEDSIAYTGVVLAAYALGLLGYALREFITRVFYAETDYKTPFYNSLFSVTVNIVLNFILGSLFGAVGLALATTIAAYTAVVTMLVLRKRKNQPLMTKSAALRSFAAVLPTAAFWAACSLLRSTSGVGRDLVELLIGAVIFCISVLLIKPFHIGVIQRMLKNE